MRGTLKYRVELSLENTLRNIEIDDFLTSDKLSEYLKDDLGMMLAIMGYKVDFDAMEIQVFDADGRLAKEVTTYDVE